MLTRSPSRTDAPAPMRPDRNENGRARPPRGADRSRARCRAARYRPTTRVLASPSGTDRQIVAVAVVGLARHSHRVDPIRRFAPDHEHRTVLAPAVVLLVRHPGPDDLSRVRCAVAVGRVADAELLDPVGVDAHRLLSPRGISRAGCCGAHLLGRAHTRDRASRTSVRPRRPVRSQCCEEDLRESCQDAVRVAHTVTLTGVQASASAYPSSPCTTWSTPAISSSLVTRKPIVFSIAKPMMKATTKE